MTVPEDVARRTWRSDDVDAAEVAALRAASGMRVSVVIPALDEAATVAAAVAAAVGLTARGGHATPVVDEVIVVDGGSTDDTAALARDAGAQVLVQDRAPDRRRAGKGDALRSGVAAASGDVVVFVDADVSRPDPRTIVALVRPIVADPSVRFVKACYDRTLELDGHRDPLGGGRVTELLVRPLLATLWPELAFVAQPLAGEYAAERDLLVTLPFVRGYGVELGLLLDVARLAGVEAIAQVDLGARSHRHQDLRALGRMATEIALVAFDRLEREGRVPQGLVRGDVLWQPTRGDDGTLHPEGHPSRPSDLAPLLAPSAVPTDRAPSAS